MREEREEGRGEIGKREITLRGSKEEEGRERKEVKGSLNILT